MIDVIFDLPDKLASLADALFVFLFSSINLFGYEISMWEIFGGLIIGFLIVRSIVRS